MFDRIIIFGIGLIGGSIAKDISMKKIAKEILAYDGNMDNINYALTNNIIDKSYNFDSRIGERDLVIIASPLSSYSTILNSIVKLIDNDAIIVDVGSVKSFVKSDILLNFNKLANNFVPCHPIAGLEKSGIKNSVSDLFKEKKLIITQNSLCSDHKINKIISFWQKLGSNVEVMGDVKHDKIFALTSHLPQLISFHLNQLDQGGEFDDLITTRHVRLQKSDINIWKDIFDLNKVFISKYLVEYKNNIKIVEDCLITENYDKLVSLLQESLEIVNVDNDVKWQNYQDIDELFVISRIFTVSSFLLINDIKSYQNYSGSGFKDFTIILFYLKYYLDSGKLLNILRNNKGYFIDFLCHFHELNLDKLERY